MHRDGEDGLDVSQHCIETLRIRAEVHFCQYDGSADILDRNTKNINKWKAIYFSEYAEQLLADIMAVMLPPPGGMIENCNMTWLSIFTFLSRHFDGFSVAECPFPFPCGVHFVLYAAVDNPKLYLRQNNSRERGIENITALHWGIDAITTLMFLLIKMLQSQKKKVIYKPTSFFTVKPIDTDTNGNLHKRN